MKLLIHFIFLVFINYNLVTAQEVECQGAIIRVLNKTTNEKNYFTTPLSQTIELYNSSIVIHRCIKVENEGKNDEVALLTHKLKNKLNNEDVFFGWIFKSTQYLNAPKNPIYDIRLEKCLIDDPIFLNNKESI
tara:strand:+ start:428 stop:826 length:399 start_codon:yes stop_codon:yes gene_type:complete